MPKRKICCFCERWADGGIESFLCSTLSRMDLRNLEVDIVAARLERSELSAKLEALGVTFRELSGQLQNIPENHRLFRRLLRQRQYDVVHLHIYQGLSLYYCRIARQEGVTVRIAHSHNENLRKSRGRWLKLLLHRLGRHCFTGDATALWACSKGAAAFLFGEDRTFTFIPNGIDTGRFRFHAGMRQKLRGELGLDGFVLGHVGRLCSRKNQRFLLDILPHCPGMRLLLVGDGEDREALTLHARELGAENRVMFYGKTRQVERLLWAMDAFALPSLFEGLSVAAVEAQCAGLPVLCAEGLSPEVKLTESLRFLPPEPAVWAAQLMAASEAKDREAAADVIRAAGFEAGEVARQIEAAYWEQSPA